MASSSEYVPPKVWTWNKPSGGRFANINRPIAGPTHDRELPVGRHPLQLYSLGTPNGVKVTVMLEELLALGHSGAEYDAWLIKIGDGEQFGIAGWGGGKRVPRLDQDGLRRMAVPAHASQRGKRTARSASSSSSGFMASARFAQHGRAA